MLVRRERALAAAAIMLDVAFHAGRGTTVSAADIAGRTGLARRGIEPVLQTLSRCGLLESARGPRGGYRLGRPRRQIRLDEIVDQALSDDAAAEDGPGGELTHAAVAPLWQALEAGARAQLSALTLDDLVRQAEAAGLQRPGDEPITYAI